MPEINFRGVYAAAVTPLTSDFNPDVESFPEFLDFLAHRGCHGALILGTTGEGPSFSYSERELIYQAAINVKKVHNDFILLAGTGSPSLKDTIQYTQLAFDLGMDGVVVIPPYYFKNITDEGLFMWYSQVIAESVPNDGALFGYHIPQVSQISLSIELLKRLKNEFPNQFLGLKNSSNDPLHTQELGKSFGEDLIIFTGNDHLFQMSLSFGASGCITAPANLFSEDLRIIWDSHQNRTISQEAQEHITNARSILDRYGPAAPLIKALLARRYAFPRWEVRQPLLPLPIDEEEQVSEDLGWSS
jgi:4-hydroxy-tetrahydrodipicolinate synthase